MLRRFRISERGLREALIVAGLTTVLAAFLGLVLFLAGSLVLGVDVGLGHPVHLALPDDLMARGPLGWATWMALVGACGAPILGAAAFAAFYAGRPAAK